MLLLGGATIAAQPSAPQLQYEATDILKLPPDMYLGEAAGVATNSKGHIFVYSRTQMPGTMIGMRAAQLFEFGPDGKFIREIGRNLYSMAWAHAVRIDKQDNIWLVDNGSSYIVKLSCEGKVLLTLGRRAESVSYLSPPPPEPRGTPPPPAKPGIFNEPTDVAWDLEGNIYISDGYKNSRVAKFDKDGNILKNWGEKGSAVGQFSTPHAIAVDNSGNVYVADRGNARVQVFDSDGKPLRQWSSAVPTPTNYVANIPDFGRRDGQYNTLFPNTLCITPGPTQALFVVDMIPGRIYKYSLDGKLLGYFGESGHKVGQFAWIHGIACIDDNTLLTAELLNWRVQKITVRSGKSTDSSW
jgi:hypothetical protein